MIRLCTVKEIVANLLSYKFFVVMLLAVLLLASSLFIMHRDYTQRLDDYRVIQPKPGAPTAVLPPNPLSIFIKGVDEVMGRSFEITPIGITTRSGQKSGNIFFLFFPTPDFLFIAQMVLSLVALLLGFDQISRERESGTLKLMLANAVPRSHILLGKWLGNFLSLALPILLTTLLGFAALQFDSAIHFDAGQIGRFLLILFCTLLYMAQFLSLGLLISCHTRRASTSLVALLVTWVMMVFVVPSLGALVARQTVDLPSVKALSEQRQRTWTSGIIEALQQPTDRDWHATYRAIHRRNDLMEEDYLRRYDELLRVSRRYTRFSPTAAYMYAVSDLAGTGMSEESRFKQEVVRYKNAVLEKVIAAADSAAPAAPAMHYRHRSLGEVLAAGTLIDLAWLLFYNLFFFILAHTAFLHYDVR